MRLAIRARHPCSPIENGQLNPYHSESAHPAQAGLAGFHGYPAGLGVRIGYPRRDRETGSFPALPPLLPPRLVRKLRAARQRPRAAGLRHPPRRCSPPWSTLTPRAFAQFPHHRRPAGGFRSLHGKSRSRRHAAHPPGRVPAQLATRFESCIECGLCVSACPIAGSDPRYAGPAALAAAWRSLEEPRQSSRTDLITLVDAEKGVWRCHAAFECTEVCPSNVDPAGAIMSLRRILLTGGQK